MKAFIAPRVCAISVACFLLISVVHGSPSQFHRFRRAAEDAVVSSSPMSAGPSASPMMMSTMSSMHEGHKVNCDNVDKASLKGSCPSNDKCPSDTETVEKCCHCLSMCCDASVGDSTESSTEKGKDMGTKVKDAINSAEGWLKNQGDKIKDQWGKAKDSMKETATNVKDKVQKGMESVANKFRNATRGNGTMGADSTSESSEMSSESATMMPMTPAPGGQKKTKRDLYGVAGPTMYESHYSSSGGRGDTSDSSDSDEYSWSKSTRTMTGSRDSNSRRYKRGTSDKSSSMSGNSSSTPSSTASSSTTDKAGRTKRDSGSGRSSSADSSNGSNSNTTDTNTNSTKNSRSRRDDRRGDSSSGSLPPVKTSTATTVTEGTVSENGRSSTSSSSSQSNSRSRYRREDNKGMAKGNSNKEGSTSSPPQSNSGNSSSPSSTETGSHEDEEETSFQGGSWDGNHEGKNNSQKKDSNVAIIVHVVGPPKSGRSNKFSKANKVGGSQDSGNWERYHNRPTQHPILSPGENGGPINMESNEDDDEDVDMVMEQPPIIFPDGNRGGVISSSAWSSSGGGRSGSGRSPSARSHRGQYEMDDRDRSRGESEKFPGFYQERSGAEMDHTTMRINEESAMLSSLSGSSSGMWRHESDGNDDHGLPGRTVVIEEVSSQYRREPISSTYPIITDGENTRPSAAAANWSVMEVNRTEIETGNLNSTSGAVTEILGPNVPLGHSQLGSQVGCVTLLPTSPQCSLDSDCTGSMRCGFTTCEPNGHVGICADLVHI